MKRFFFNVFFVFLLVIYIYSLVFKAIPLSTKIIFEGIGVLWCFRYFGPKYRIRKEFLVLIRVIFIMLLWDLVTCLINNSIEFHYVKVILPILGSFFATQVLFDLAKKKGIGQEDFLYLIVVTIFFESILAVVMKTIPSVYYYLDSLLVFDFGGNSDSDIFEKARFYGVGNAIYFGVLPSCTLGTMTSVYLLLNAQGALRRLALILMYIVIGSVSFLIARTSIIIFFVSFLLLIFLSFKKSPSSVLKILIGAIGVFLIVLYLTIDYFVQNDELSMWLFDFVENDSQTGSAWTVIRWWKETTFDIKTFIVGDAQYVSAHGGYYKGVDVGYFRQIFYGGIIGLLMNLYLHAKILFYTYKNSIDVNIKYIVIGLFLCYLVILGKGDSTMCSLFILYLTIYCCGVFRLNNSNKMKKALQ